MHFKNITEWRAYTQMMKEKEQSEMTPEERIKWEQDLYDNDLGKHLGPKKVTTTTNEDGSVTVNI